MKKQSVYQYKGYKRYILDWIEQTPNAGRGQRKNLAEAVGCQTPFVTHVLSGDYHFSLEQGEACARWMGLDDGETEFFLLLLMKERAGTQTLKNLFQKQIDSRLATVQTVGKKVEIKETLDLESQATYYSHWLYSAVHMAVLIPQYRTLESLQKKFQVPTNQLMNVIEFLKEHKLIELTRGQFKVTKSLLYLPKTSPLLPMYHSNWRLKATECSQIANSKNFHYTSAISLSQEAYDWIQNKLITLIGEAAEQVKPSADEKVACLLIDLFEV